MKKILGVFFVLCFTQISFAGWSKSGSYFMFYDGNSKLIDCSYFMSTNNYSVTFYLHEIGGENWSKIPFVSYTDLKGDVISVKERRIAPQNGVLIKSNLYFHDTEGSIYQLNIENKKVIEILPPTNHQSRESFRANKGIGLSHFQLLKNNIIYCSGNNILNIYDIKNKEFVSKMKINGEITNIHVQPNQEFFLISLSNGKTIIYDSETLKTKDTLDTHYGSFFSNNYELTYQNIDKDSLITYNFQTKRINSRTKYLSGSYISSIKNLEDRYHLIEEIKYPENRADDGFLNFYVVNKTSGIIYKEIKKDLIGINRNDVPFYLGYDEYALNFYLEADQQTFKTDLSDLFKFTEDNNGPQITLEGYKDITNEIFTTTEETVLIKGFAFDQEQQTKHSIKIEPQKTAFNYTTKDTDGLFIGLNIGVNTILVSAKDKYGNETREKLIIRRINKVRGSVANSKKASIEDKIGSFTYKALLISNQNYTNEIEPLEFPNKDALKLKSILETKYSFEKENIVHIQDATRSEIINVLDSLVATINQKDNLLIFYAGHGVFDENLNKGYWLPIDAKSQSKSNWVSNSDIRDYLISFKSQHTLLLTDACFSGSIFEFKKRDLTSKEMKVSEKLLSKKSRKAMTSGLNKPVPDESIFIKYLLKELDQNKKSFIRSGELYNEIREAVISNTDNNPQFEIIKNSGHEGGEFIFLKRNN